MYVYRGDELDGGLVIAVLSKADMGGGAMLETRGEVLRQRVLCWGEVVDGTVVWASVLGGTV